MSKLAVGLLFAGFAAMPFVDQSEIADQRPIAYNDVQASFADQAVYVVRSSAGASCRIVVERNASQPVRVKADKMCADVHKNLDQVTRWTSEGEGANVLADAAGTAVLQLSLSDGFAYEAIADDGAQISFSVSEI